MKKAATTLLLLAPAFSSTQSLAACDDKLVKYKTTYNATLYNKCTDENMRGEKRYRFYYRCTEKNGKYTYQWSTNSGGKLIGQKSGDEYQVVSSGGGREVREGSSLKFSYRTRTQYKNKDGGETFLVHYNCSYTESSPAKCNIYKTSCE